MTNSILSTGRKFKIGISSMEISHLSFIKGDDPHNEK